jgi:hypothetical protein
MIEVVIVTVFIVIIEPILICHFWHETREERKVLKSSEACINAQEIAIFRLVFLLKSHGILTEEDAAKFEFLRRHWGKINQ